MDKAQSTYGISVIFDDVQKFFDKFSRAKIFVFFAGMLFLFVFFRDTLPFLQPFAAAMVIASIAAWLWLEADEHLLRGVDTFTEIVTNRNMSYAIVLLALAIIISTSILAAFVVFLALR